MSQNQVKFLSLLESTMHNTKRSGSKVEALTMQINKVNDNLPIRPDVVHMQCTNLMQFSSTLLTINKTIKIKTHRKPLAFFCGLYQIV